MKRQLLFCAIAIAFLMPASRAMSQSDRVLVELFRNVNCGNCRLPDITYEDWLKKNPQANAAVIYYHNHITDPQDPFYLASKPEVDFRSGPPFYALDNLPWMVARGVEAGSDVNDWIELTQQVKTDIPFAVGLSVTELSAAGGNISFKVDAVNNSGRSVRVYAALTESGIIYDNPRLYGNPPSGTWDHIFRKMLPDRDGTDPFTGNQSFTFSFNASAKTWNINNMDVIVWAQDDEMVSTAGKLVYGTVELPLSTGSVQQRGSLLGITASQNPFATVTSIELSLTEPAFTSVVVRDVNGHVVATLANEIVGEGSTLLQFAPNGLSAGMYFVTASAAGHMLEPLKLIYQP